MATIIVEDGSNVSGANSYITEAELATYAADRGITLVGDPNQLIVLSMDYIESLKYKGVKFSEEQPLQWPRYNVIVDGYYVDSDEIPKELVQGQLATAIAIDQGNGPLNVIERTTKREKVDVLEIEYSDSSTSKSIDPNISNSLQKLLKAGSGGTSYTVVRG
jgi:hypothetical protein